MLIHVFGKPGCGKCEACKNKLKLMGYKYREFNFEAIRAEPPEDWRTIGARDVAAHHAGDDTLPIVWIKDSDADLGVAMSYPAAMRRLKSVKLSRKNTS